MSEMREELAVTGEGHFGLRDTGRPCLWFEVELLRGCALQAFTDLDRIEELVVESGCSDIRHFRGKACVVSTDGAIVKFVRWT